ncbi:hypothetical protein SMD44_08010 [Streptomyces alboflavus]|uniref:Uncharacterized protein n=1 Tax=Streptomyces alboflavus TaxID=67267 RepID=A0A1Z1WQ23_9ACTN|nr:hypothetical protein SMD44_08010 [Streptomyces alboflavus]
MLQPSAPSALSSATRQPPGPTPPLSIQPRTSAKRVPGARSMPSGLWPVSQYARARAQASAMVLSE